MARIRRTLLFVLVAGVVASAASVAVAQGTPPKDAVGIRLLDLPTRRAEDPRARLYLVDHVSPGTTVTRRVELSNGTDRPVRLSLYAAGAEVQKGQFRFLDGRRLNELAGWASVQPGLVVVPSGGTTTATVTVDVPPDASAGERYAVVWAEMPKSVAAGGSVSAVHRVGVRVYLSVGPGGEPPSRFVVESVVAERTRDGRPVIVARVRNTGGRALDLSGELRLTGGPGGLRAGPFPARLGTTLGLGESGWVRVPLDPAVPAGPWRVRITLRSGVVQETGSSTVVFPARRGSAAPAAPTTTDTAAVGRTPLAVCAGLVLVGVGMVLRRRRQRRAEGEGRP